jgi:hypothetical protein
MWLVKAERPPYISKKLLQMFTYIEETEKCPPCTLFSFIHFQPRSYMTHHFILNSSMIYINDNDINDIYFPLLIGMNHTIIVEEKKNKICTTVAVYSFLYFLPADL